MSGTRTAAGIGLAGNHSRYCRLCSSVRPGSSTESSSWRARVPARRSRMRASQSMLTYPDVASADSATPARSALDTSAGELGRVEQFREIIARDVRELLGDFADGSAFLVRLLRDGSAFFIADDRVQRRHQNGVALQGLGQTS